MKELKRPLPLLENWVKDLRNPNVDVFIRENSCRELLEVRDYINEVVAEFNIEREKAVYKRKRQRA